MRRETVRAGIDASERRARHLLVLAGVLSVAVVFAGRDFHLSLSALGISHEITFVEISAVAPLLLAYLVLYSTLLGARNMRLDHQCRVLDLELQRFGGPTSYGTLSRFNDHCRKEPGTWEQLVSSRTYHAIYWIHDAFLSACMLLAFGSSAWVAFTVREEISVQHSTMAVLFIVYVLVAALVSIASPAMFLSIRKKKDRLLNEYLRTHGPVSST